MSSDTVSNTGSTNATDQAFYIQDSWTVRNTGLTLNAVSGSTRKRILHTIRTASLRLTSDGVIRSLHVSEALTTRFVTAS